MPLNKHSIPPKDQRSNIKDLTSQSKFFVAFAASHLFLPPLKNFVWMSRLWLRLFHLKYKTKLLNTLFHIGIRKMKLLIINITLPFWP